MTTKELVAGVTTGTAYKKSQVANILRKILNTITRELAQGGTVQLVGFGKFMVKDNPAMETFNPQTGERVKLPPSKRAFFKQGKSLKEAVRYGS